MPHAGVVAVWPPSYGELGRRHPRGQVTQDGPWVAALLVTENFTQALKALASFVVAEMPLDDALLQIADITVAAVPGAAMAGITMVNGKGKPQTAIFTDARSPRIDEAQYQADSGPCLDAWRDGRAVRLDDMRTAKGRYPEFARAAMNEQIFSTLSLPLVAGTSSLGAMNLYAEHAFAFTDVDEQSASEVATSAAVVLANATAYWAATDLTQQLRIALQSRAVIEQAKGMLMAGRTDLRPDDAFDILRRASQRENVKLRDIAQRIVERQPMRDEPDF